MAFRPFIFGDKGHSFRSYGVQELHSHNHLFEDYASNAKMPCLVGGGADESLRLPFAAAASKECIKASST